jgi:hypothetical protein
MSNVGDTGAAPPIWVWIVAVLIGAFLVNSVPHGVMGITGQSFPTPFSGGPPNLSPAWLNVVWSLINIAIGYGLLRLVARWRSQAAVQWTMIVAGALAAVGLALVFASLWVVPVTA